MFSIALATATATEEHRSLPFPAWAFGLLALVAFFVLFLFTWSFRSVGKHH